MIRAAAAFFVVVVYSHIFGCANVVLVKVGGSSITHKAIKETWNPNALDWFVRAVKHAVSQESLSFVLVHGAGSFGHHTATEYGLHGQTKPPRGDSADDAPEGQQKLMQGLGHTRLSVQKLNQAIVSAFLEQDLAAVGISPCFGVPGMQAHGGDETAKNHLRKAVKASVAVGLIPILHGDACLYGKHGAGILSGDTVMEILGQAEWVSHVVFLTDVDGVFTADPNTNATVVLIRTLTVDTATAEITSSEFLDASGSTHEHDVTGGLKTKLASAASIAAAGKNVTITRCGSVSAEQALRAAPDVDVATVLIPTSRASKSSIDSATDSTVISVRTFARTMQARYRKMLVDFRSKKRIA